MKIDKTVLDTHAILSLKGEFDTFYCPKLQEEVDGLLASGVIRVILNMRLVKFINSTALGAVIKAHKRFRAENGNLVVARVSPFVREIMTKLGIDRIVPLFEDEEAAERFLLDTVPEEAAEEATADDTSLIFSVADEERIRLLKGKRAGVAAMGNVDAQRVQFVWNASRHGLAAGDVAKLFKKGAPLRTKFQIKLFKKGYFDLEAEVEEVRDRKDGTFKVTARYRDIPESDRTALTQFARDMAYLKSQVEEASEQG